MGVVAAAVPSWSSLQAPWDVALVTWQLSSDHVPGLHGFFWPADFKVIKLDAAGFWISQGQVDEAALEAEMNRLGSEGWELVSAFDTNRGGGETRDVIAVFKRPAG